MAKKTRRSRDGKVQLWATKDRPAWEAAARAEGMSLSAWLRRAANRAVEIEAKQERIREVLT